MATTVGSTSLAALFDKIKDIKICMFTTVESDGKLRSRPMAAVSSDEETGEIWFFTNEYSAKVNEINKTEEVNIAYADPADDLYVSISGTAEVVIDHEKMSRLWNPIYKAWFPEGLEDPKLALICIIPSQAEYWDAPSNKAIQIFGMARALVTGEEFKQGENKKFNF